VDYPLGEVGADSYADVGGGDFRKALSSDWMRPRRVVVGWDLVRWTDFILFFEGAAGGDDFDEDFDDDVESSPPTLGSLRLDALLFDPLFFLLFFLLFSFSPSLGLNENKESTLLIDFVNDFLKERKPRLSRIFRDPLRDFRIEPPPRQVRAGTMESKGWTGEWAGGWEWRGL